MEELKKLYYKIPDLSVNQEVRISKIVNLLGLVVILLSISVCLYMYYVNRSLWVDEAMLAYSVVQRSLGNLTSQMLDKVQSAPILYLYIVKIITLIFGNSEATLRVFAFVSYLLTLYLSFHISKKLLNIKYPILPVAFVAGMWIMIRYSNEFKPYMTDAMVVLLALAIYGLYSRQVIKSYLFIAFLCVLVWFSNPVCFVIASILLYELFEGIKDKSTMQIKNSIIAGVFIFISFLIYYFYWLKPLVDTGLMQQFWARKNFPLIPTTALDVYHFELLTREIIQYLGSFRSIIFLSIILGAFFNIFYLKNRYVNIINLTLLITLVVSWMGMFPIQDRMCLFFYPLFALLFFFYLSQLFSKKWLLHIPVLIFAFLVVFSAQGISYFSQEEHLYMQEMNKAVDFLEEEITDKDLLYIPNGEEACQYLYLKDYNTEKLGYEVLFGHQYWWDEEILHEGEMEKLIDHAKDGNLYILTFHGPGFFILDTLKNYGEVDHIYNKYEKHIYKINSLDHNEIEEESLEND